MSRSRNARGVSLIEVVIAIAIFSTVLISLGGLMFQMARHSRISGNTALRAAAVESAAAWIQAVPWDSIPTLVGCLSDSVGSFTYSRCTTYSNVSTELRQVSVVLTADSVVGILPDTLVVRRMKPRAGGSLYSP